MRCVITLLVFLSLSACVTTKQIAEKMASLTDVHFKSTTTVKDGSLETSVQFSTRNGFEVAQGLLGIVSEDTFLRAFINKKTHNKLFQVYYFLTYQRDSWHFLRYANYSTPNGPVSVDIEKLGRDVDCSGSLAYGCVYREDVAFEIDENLVRYIASLYQTTKRQPVAWKFRIKSKSGRDFDVGITTAEFKGLIDKMDEYEKYNM